MVYLLTMILTEFLSNNATAILLTPIAIGLAEGIGVDPRPFVVAVMMAASNAFATPVGYQTNTFVYNAGGYRFADFVRIGLPLNMIIWLAASLLDPFLLPLALTGDHASAARTAGSRSLRSSAISPGPAPSAAAACSHTPAAAASNAGHAGCAAARGSSRPARRRCPPSQAPAGRAAGSRPARRGRHDRVRPLQQHDRTGLPARRAAPGRAGRPVIEQAGILAVVRASGRSAWRRAEQVGARSPRSWSARRRRGPRAGRSRGSAATASRGSGADARTRADQEGGEARVGEQRGECGGVGHGLGHHRRELGGVDRQVPRVRRRRSPARRRS